MPLTAETVPELKKLGGTLLVKDVSFLSAADQAALIELLPGKSECRSMAHRDQPIHVVAATDDDLELKAEEGSFRTDLFHRLDSFRIVMPPFRQRPEDVISLAEHVLAYQQPNLHLTQDAIDLMITYDWPGNADEIIKVIRTAAFQASCGMITSAVLEPMIQRRPLEIADAASSWARRLMAGMASYDDLRQEFRRESNMMRAILRCLVLLMKTKLGRRPTEKDLVTILKIEPGNVANLLSRNRLRLNDFR